MKIKKHSRQWATVDTEYGEFELESQPYDDEVIVKVEGVHAVVGYLMHDEDCVNPLEDGDSFGHIYSSHRNAGREEHQKMQEALGLNSDWRPDFEQFEEEAEEQILISALNSIPGVGQVYAIEWFNRDHEIATDLYLVSIAGEDNTDLAGVEKGWADANTYIHDVIFRGNTATVGEWEEEAKRIWWHKRESGEIGNKYAVLLDVYDHSGVWYSVSGEGMQCQWDTARGGAVWVPNDYLLKDEIENLPEEKRQARAIELARQACEEYTAWCNGECYGWVVESFWNNGSDDEPKWEQFEHKTTYYSPEKHTYTSNSESCWGYIGYKYAKEELEREVNDWFETWFKLQGSN